jgi:hypothetical protein
MLNSRFKLTRTTVGGAIALGAAIALFSLGTVRAEHVTPDKSKTYSCSSGFACIEGISTGSAYGVYGTSSGAQGIYGPLY